MPLPEEGALSASQVATEFGVSSADIEFRNLGTFVGILHQDKKLLYQIIFMELLQQPQQYKLMQLLVLPLQV